MDWAYWYWVWELLGWVLELALLVELAVLLVGLE